MSVHRRRQAQSCTLEAGLIRLVCSPTSRICWARISRSSRNCSCLWCFSCSRKARNSSFCFFFSLAVKLKWTIWISCRDSLFIIHNNSLLWKINCIMVILSTEDTWPDKCGKFLCLLCWREFKSIITIKMKIDDTIIRFIQ